jgi:hypothetical protein
MRRLIAVALISLFCTACSPIDPRHAPAEQKDTGHVDTGGGGGGAM